ncbi:MAG TPA: TonB family protein [Gemmatimonadales bacterium]|nr:TonB family protein [Gemmatimonadales bacterium]
MKRTLGIVTCLGALGCTTPHISSRQIQDVRPLPTSCDGAPSADTTVYDSTQLSEQPAPRSVPKPEYPADARKHRMEGRVIVAAVVNADGSVDSSSVDVTAGAYASLDAEARRVVSLTKFWPACRDGVAVRSRIVAPFDFKLTGDSEGVVVGVLAGVWAGAMVIMGTAID